MYKNARQVIITGYGRLVPRISYSLRERHCSIPTYKHAVTTQPIIQKQLYLSTPIFSRRNYSTEEEQEEKEKEEVLSILAFYRGKRFEYVISCSDYRLEKGTKWAEWLFPIPERVRPYSTVPLLDKDTLEAFRNDPWLRERVHLAFRRVLAFYGFKLEESPGSKNEQKEGPRSNGVTGGSVVVIPDEHFARALYSWSNDRRNNLRIARIIRSLRFLQFNAEAQAFFKALKEVYENRVAHPHRLGIHGYILWKRAALRDLEYSFLYRHDAVEKLKHWKSVQAAWIHAGKTLPDTDNVDSSYGAVVGREWHDDNANMDTHDAVIALSRSIETTNEATRFETYPYATKDYQVPSYRSQHQHPSKSFTKPEKSDNAQTSTKNTKNPNITLSFEAKPSLDKPLEHKTQWAKHNQSVLHVPSLQNSEASKPSVTNMVHESRAPVPLNETSASTHLTIPATSQSTNLDADHERERGRKVSYGTR